MIPEEHSSSSIALRRSLHQSPAPVVHRAKRFVEKPQASPSQPDYTNQDIRNGLRDYQVPLFDKILASKESGGGIVDCATGIGKSLLQFAAMLYLHETGQRCRLSILVTPRLALQKQMAAYILDRGKCQVIAKASGSRKHLFVGSDSDETQKYFDSCRANSQREVHAEYCNATRDKAKVHAFLAEPGSKQIIVTYDSLWPLLEAVHEDTTVSIDIAVLDEAHRAAGEEKFRGVFEPEKGLRARSRWTLFFSATPAKLQKKLVKKKITPALPTICDYPAWKAVGENVLCGIELVMVAMPESSSADGTSTAGNKVLTGSFASLEDHNGQEAEEDSRLHAPDELDESSRPGERQAEHEAGGCCSFDRKEFLRRLFRVCFWTCKHEYQFVIVFCSFLNARDAGQSSVNGFRDNVDEIFEVLDLVRAEVKKTDPELANRRCKPDAKNMYFLDDRTSVESVTKNFQEPGQPGDMKIVFAANKLNEGNDLPYANVAAPAYLPGDEDKWIQMCGRVMRNPRYEPGSRPKPVTVMLPIPLPLERIRKGKTVLVRKDRLREALADKMVEARFITRFCCALDLMEKFSRSEAFSQEEDAILKYLVRSGSTERAHSAAEIDSSAHRPVSEVEKSVVAPQLVADAELTAYAKALPLKLFGEDISAMLDVSREDAEAALRDAFLSTGTEIAEDIWTKKVTVLKNYVKTNATRYPDVNSPERALWVFYEQQKHSRDLFGTMGKRGEARIKMLEAIENFQWSANPWKVSKMSNKRAAKHVEPSQSSSANARSAKKPRQVQWLSFEKSKMKNGPAEAKITQKHADTITKDDIIGLLDGSIDARTKGGVPWVPRNFFDALGDSPLSHDPDVVAAWLNKVAEQELPQAFPHQDSQLPAYAFPPMPVPSTEQLIACCEKLPKMTPQGYERCVAAILGTEKPAAALVATLCTQTKGLQKVVPVARVLSRAEEKYPALKGKWKV
ncbi:unnamed protein product [Amoebophrya sp. A120]|nr:unnamed protein product [Amoebophrya sp. A120]|eukprot:GSA120T00023984001.1